MSDIPKHADELTCDRLALIRETISADYEEAAAGKEAALECIELTLDEQELEALWELYNRYEVFVKGAVTDAWDSMKTELTQEETVREAPRLFATAIGVICYRETDLSYFSYELYKQVRDRTWEWMARRTTQATAGSEALTRLIRRELRKRRERPNPSEFAAELRESHHQAERCALDYVEDRVRDVLAEQHMQSLDRPAYEDSNRTLSDITPADTDRRPSAKVIGERLAERWGMETLWELLMTYDRSWSSEETRLLGTASDSEVAKRLGHTTREVRGKREELGIEAETARPSQALTQEEAAEVRERYESEDIYQKELANDYGVSTATVRRAIHREGSY